MVNCEKMRAKCVAWIEQGLGACRAPITYEELNQLLDENKALRAEARKYKLTGLAMAVQLGERGN